MHQFGQLALILELCPICHQLISLSPAVVLVSLHLGCQVVVMIHGQHIAVDINQLAAPQCLQSNVEQVGDLVANLRLDVSDYR